jgi:hypothetical protein
MVERNLELPLFTSFHHVDLFEAQYLRAVVEENLIIISNYLETGKVTIDQYDIAISDPELQFEHEKMIGLLQDGSNKEFNVLHDKMLKNPVKFCVWLDYFNRFLIINTDLNLIPDKSNRHYKEFLNRNKMTQFPEG